MTENRFPIRSRFFYVPSGCTLKIFNVSLKHEQKVFTCMGWSGDVGGLHNCLHCSIINLILMDKSALLQSLESKGQVNTFQKTPEWVAAFDAYKKATGDHQVDYGCGGCYKTVLKWLRS